jgi:hypothetical protein
MLALHLVQAALVYLNTLLVQRVLLDEEWKTRLTEEDRGASRHCSGPTCAPTARSSWTWTRTWTWGSADANANRSRARDCKRTSWVRLS